MDHATKSTRHREKRRALGLRTTEAMLHEREIADLDALRDRLGLASRSEAIRLVLAKSDLRSFTSADATALWERVG